LERLDDGDYLLGPGEVIVVNELGGGGVVQREIEAESRVVEKELGWAGSLSQPLKFAELEGVSEGSPSDRQVQDGVPLGLAIDRQQESKEDSSEACKIAGESTCGALLAEQPHADEDGRGSYGAETKISRTVGDSQKESDTD